MTKKEYRQEQLLRHYNNLASLFTLLGGKTANGKVLTGRQLSLKLLKLENYAHTAALDWCNGDITMEKFEQVSEDVTGQILELFPNIKGFFVNGDARGYALKIKTEIMNELKYPIGTDWGGYGILSPEIN